MPAQPLSIAISFDEGFAPATRLAYASDWRGFVSWANEGSHIAIPASPETIVAYIEFMSVSKAPATIARHLATIATVHRDSNAGAPTAMRPVKVAMKRLWRKAGRRQRQALAITYQRREEMIDAATTDLKGLRDRALISVAYDLGCRRSELVSLRIEDIDRVEGEAGTILIRKSKTDQEGTGSVRFLAPTTLDAIDRWLDRARIEDGMLFRSVTRYGAVGASLEAGSVSKIYKDLCRAAAHTVDAVLATSGHSTRVGMAQDMAAAGIDLAGIMQAGNWKSPMMVARYIERLSALKGAAARLAETQGRR